MTITRPAVFVIGFLVGMIVCTTLAGNKAAYGDAGHCPSTQTQPASDKSRAADKRPNP